jgi:hypothetical protein
MAHQKGIDLPFKCKFCSKYYYGRNRLPENHNCPGLKRYKLQRRKEFRRKVEHYIKEKSTPIHATYRPQEHFCIECGNKIRPYREGYTKCKECSLKSTRTTQTFDQEYYYQKRKTSYKMPSFSTLIFYLILVMLFSALFSPFYLMLTHPNMAVVLGNPRPLYFYDIDPSCMPYEITVEQSLSYLSGETGVKFIRLPSPSALVIGGISYTCDSILTNRGAIGESESGHFGISFFLISWHRVKILYPSTEIILHETLHSMSFGHNNDNPTSIMFPYYRGYSQVDGDIVNFIKTAYANNPLAYLNIIPLNLLYILILLLFILRGIVGGLISRLLNVRTG